VPDGSQTEPEVPVDALRRTRLANERTYLAWWRTGLGAIAAGFGIGAFGIELSSGKKWPYATVGSLYILIGVLTLLYGVARQRQVDDALARGAWAAPSPRTLAVLGVAGAALGIATGALLISLL
jgi:putative membrane protein